MAKTNLLLFFALVTIFGQFVQQTLAKRKSCTYNGVEYTAKQEVLQGSNCCICKPSGKFVCSTQTLCYKPPGCAHYTSGGCCPKCECKNAAGEVMKFKDKWTHTVDGLCYECMCKQHNTASCKAAKPCKKQCASEEKADSRKCCSCGKPIPPERTPPKKYKTQKEFENYIASLG